MGKLTQYTGGVAVEGEAAVARWIGSEADYDAIILVSDPSDVVNYDDTDPNFDPLFENTLYFIHE